MKIYVASKFENKEQVQLFMSILRNHGHDIVGDWTSHSIEGIPESERESYLCKSALEDYQAVKRCDALLLIDHPNMAGAYTEVGIAIADLKRVVVFGEGRDNIFFHLPLVFRVNSTSEMLALFKV